MSVTAEEVCGRLDCEGRRLVEGNVKMARAAAWRFVRGSARRAREFDRYYSAALEGLCRAALRFDAGMGFQFSSYAWPAMERCMIREWSRARRESSEVRMPESFDAGWPDRDEGDGGRAHVRLLLSFLAPAEREFVRLRYGGGGMSLKAAGRALGLNRRQVCAMDRRVLSRLRAAAEEVNRA